MLKMKEIQQKRNKSIPNFIWNLMHAVCKIKCNVQTAVTIQCFQLCTKLKPSQRTNTSKSNKGIEKGLSFTGHFDEVLYWENLIKSDFRENWSVVCGRWVGGLVERQLLEKRGWDSGKGGGDCQKRGGGRLSEKCFKLVGFYWIEMSGVFF